MLSYKVDFCMNFYKTDHCVLLGTDKKCSLYFLFLHIWFDRWIYCHYLDVQPSRSQWSKINNHICKFSNFRAQKYSVLCLFKFNRILPFFDPPACTVFIPCAWTKTDIFWPPSDCVLKWVLRGHHKGIKMQQWN
jgi:hypothetical protein